MPSSIKDILPLAMNGDGAALSDDTPTVLSKSLRARQGGDNQFAHLLRGRRLAHFELEEPIGVGGMAAVIKARDVQLDRAVALKILPPEMAAEAENIRRFQQEARSAAKLDHENIARVFYFGEDQGLHFIAFEFVAGENLRTLIERDGKIPVAEALSYAGQIAAGLIHAAERGVVHRDIKPSNIIIEENGRAKLVDMGLARSQETHPDHGLTQSGVTLGTFDYISPEQALEPREADVRSDIYSLGCTLYHMLTGQPPVPEGTAAKKLQFHQQGEPIDPRQLNAEIPDEVAAILGKMMAKEPHKRYQNAGELVQHLSAIAQKLYGDSKAVSHAKRISIHSILPGPPRVGPLALLAFSGVAVALIVVVIGALWNPDLPIAKQRTIAQGHPSPPQTPPPNGKEALNNERIETAKAKAPPAAIRPGTADKSRMESNPANLEDVLRRLWDRLSESKNIPATVSQSPNKAARPPVTAPAGGSDNLSARELIVDGEGKLPGTYSNLASALNEAENRKMEEEVVILIKKNGPLQIRQQEIGNRKVVVRAAPNYSPELSFNPDAAPGADGEAALFLVRDGELTLEGIQFRLDPNLRQAAKLQAAAAITGVGKCRFLNCVGTLQGRPETRVAFVSVADPAGMMATKTPIIGSPNLNFENCFIRGHGDFVNVRVSRPFVLDVNYSLIALNGTLLNIEANKQKFEGKANVLLDHVTAYGMQNLIALRVSGMNQTQVPVEITAERCIFAAGEDRPLFYVQGPDNTDALKRLFRWRGTGNLYSAGGPILVSEPTEMMAMTSRFEKDPWNKLWGSQDAKAAFARVKFAGFPDDRSLAEVVPSQFYLDSKTMNGELQEFRFDPLGADLERLPKPYAEQETVQSRR